MKINYPIILAMLAIVGCSRTDQPQTPVPCPTVTDISPNILDGAEFKKASAVEQHLQKPLESGQAEDLAKAIAEVDEWLVVPDEEAQARKLIDDAIEKLRSHITSEVTDLAKAAVSAAKGTEATDKLSGINALLTLYPAPRTEDQRKSLDELSARVLATSRRVENIRHLRYNTWAVDQLQNGLNAYRKKESWFGSNKGALLTICTNYMKYIDPGLLELPVSNLYAEFLRRCNDGLDDGRKVELARALVDPSLQRYSPNNF